MREIGTGISHLRKDSLRGSLAVHADPDSCLFTGDLVLHQATISRPVVGVSLFSATVKIEAEFPSSAESTTKAGWSPRSWWTRSSLMSTLPGGR